MALFGLLAYVFTPLSAAGADGAPVGFGINIRYAIPALLLGLLPCPAAGATGRYVQAYCGSARVGPSAWQWGSLAGLLLSSLSPTAPTPPFAIQPEPSASGPRVPRGGRPRLWLLFAVRRVPREVPRARRLRGPVPADPALGYPLQRHYLRDRSTPARKSPGLQLDTAYQWARDKRDTRIGLAGTTAGFLSYGLYGTDLSNRVVYLGEKGPHGAYNAIPTCRPSAPPSTPPTSTT